MPLQRKNMNTINSPNSLGKGEVDSSILSGSTSIACNCEVCRYWRDRHSAVSGRTQREHNISTGAKPVDSVPHPFREEAMPDDTTTPPTDVFGSLAFNRELEELVGRFHDHGLHPRDMISAFKYWHEWAKSHP
jgi:hypothetical protein